MSIESLLEAMSHVQTHKLATDSSLNVRSIFEVLTDHSSFVQYLRRLPVQTPQMKYKQILKIKEPLNNEILAMAESSTLYIDNEFYFAKMGERAHHTSYQCQIVAVNIDWLRID